MAMHRLPRNANVVQTQNELMKGNCSVSQCPFDNDALYYKETPGVSKSSKVQAFGRLTLANFSKCFTRNLEFSLSVRKTVKGQVEYELISLIDNPEFTF